MAKKQLLIQWFVLLLGLSGIALTAQAEITQQTLKQIKLPPGFEISLFAADVPAARAMALADNGVVFVGSREGVVYAVQDTNADGKADKRYSIISGLYLPNGVAYKDGTLYVAEVNRIIRFDNIIKRLTNPPEPVVVYDKFPDKRHHGWKYLRFGPDNRLYTAVGAPCNICAPEENIFTSMVRLNADGSGLEIIARGIRNSVGFDWHPVTGELYFTDNGRDYLGDDLPPDELNKWTEKGQHFGYPYCHGGDLADPKFGKQKQCSQFTAPEWKFRAHMAALGLRFYRGKQYPEQYRQQLFVAQHGSWNRSKPHGYRVALVSFKNGKAVSERTFAYGWLGKNGKVLGRPVDILEMPDGSLLVSDDHAGCIYKIEYKN